MPSPVLGRIGYTEYGRWIVIATSRCLQSDGKIIQWLITIEKNRRKSKVDVTGQEMLPARSDI